MTTSSTTLVQTPNVARIRELMNEAKEKVEGIEFRFLVTRFGSLQAAKERATSLQNQVSSIRARARNSAHVRMGQKNNEFTGEQVRGQYDDLVCFKRLIPDHSGYVVVIGPATAQEDDFEIYDRATGERILQGDPRERRFDALLNTVIEKAFNPALRPPYLTPEQERGFFDLNFDIAKITYEDCGVPFPAWVTGMAELTANPPELDLVDTPMDDFGVGPGEGE